MTTLIIDDDPFVHQLLKRQLAILGVQDVTCFERAEDALAFLETIASSGALILCDLQMPGMDGIEMVRHLATMDYRGSLILISGEDERVLQTAGLLANARNLNVLGAIHKPAAIDQLKLLLEKHLAVSTVGRPVRQTPRAAYTAEDLRQAISDNQLLCHFQPKINLATGEVIGVESLVRWQHPQDGLIFPDQFIPLAEETGLIDDLTMAVLRAALSQARRWQDDGIDLSVAVNVSMHNVVSLDFPEQIISALGTAGVAPDRLVIECTESQVMKDRAAALDILSRLRLKRIGLSIDDFGTGHSSLAQLRDLPFTELKIDQGFVNGAVRDSSRRKIFDACLRVGRDLGLKIVAEGAEDLDDWTFLRESGCDVVQGYFVARPMPGPNLPGWMTEWAQRYEELQSR